jgi:hypothetical protein
MIWKKRNVLFASIFTILTNTLFCNVPVMNFNSNILQILLHVLEVSKIVERESECNF